MLAQSCEVRRLRGAKFYKYIFCGIVCFMSELNTPDENSPLPEAGWMLFDALQRSGDDAVKFRDFLGRQVARDSLQEYGILGQFDDSLEVALIDIAGTGVVSGILLGIKGTTGQLDIEAEAIRLMEPVPEALRQIAERLTTFMIPTGVAFQRDELEEGSPRVARWTQEFQALQADDIDLG